MLMCHEALGREQCVAAINQYLDIKARNLL
jgi:hypothetical protein